TVAPLSSMDWALAQPIPEAAPVTAAILPSKLRVIWLFSKNVNYNKFQIAGRTRHLRRAPSPDIHSQQNDRALDDILQVARHADQVQTIIQNRQQQRAHKCAQPHATATGNRGTAEHDTGDGIQLITDTDTRLPAHQTRRD